MVLTTLVQEYVDQMPTVWMRDDPKRRTRFHRVPECRQLRKPPAKGVSKDLIAVDLKTVEVRPCGTCYPDAPRMSIRKLYCHTCESRYACEHNGGLLITDRAGRHYWVWPTTNQMPHYRATA